MHLKLSLVPGCVEMVGSCVVTKLHFIRSFMSVNVERKFHFEELVRFMPVDLHETVHSP